MDEQPGGLPSTDQPLVPPRPHAAVPEPAALVVAKAAPVSSTPTSVPAPAPVISTPAPTFLQAQSPVLKQATAAEVLAGREVATEMSKEVPAQAQQPLRSLSIDFTPDGARDVRLRLTEKLGDVHISMHSTDPALTGHLSAGVHDLVGSLSNAGYDAQPWTASQERQSQREPQNQPRTRRAQSQESSGFLAEMSAGTPEPVKEIA